MALMGDLHRVYEVAPVFRAENSNTHRHLTEFMGLDVEMTIFEHYYEILSHRRLFFFFPSFSLSFSSIKIQFEKKVM